MSVVVVLIALSASVAAGWLSFSGTDLSDVALYGSLLLIGGGWLLGRRDRNRPMRWRPAIRLPGGGAAPGLEAPRSVAGSACWVGVGVFLAGAMGGVTGWLLASDRWAGRPLGAVTAGAALWALYHLYGDVPALRRIAIVEAGVLCRGRLIRWAEIRAVRTTRPAGDEAAGDVRLLLTGGRPVSLTPAGSMIDPAELWAAVHTYLDAPERRAELNSPVDPRGAVALRPGTGEAERQAVEGGAEA